jgi:glycosyltransferase involved in cell wall biosynthesis
VQQRQPQAQLVVLGDGPQRKQLERHARELNLETVKFQGFVERSEMPRHYADADLFLNTSSIDNMPVSILEAFAVGLPVVTTDAGGIPCMVTEGVTGLVAQVNDHSALAEKILNLIESPDQTRRLSRNGRDEVAKYTWDAVGPQWISIYRQVAKAVCPLPRADSRRCQQIV